MTGRALTALLVAVVASACSGGGGTTEPEDTTPPPRPVAGLITVEAPQVDTAFVEGEEGAVEANARVRVTNLSASERTGATVRSTASASSAGAFTASITARLGDELEILAIDAAGNESQALLLTAGPAISSLTLRPVDNEPQVGVAGQRLEDPIQVKVTAPPPDGEVRGVAVLFEVRSGGGTLQIARDVTDSDGIAGVPYTLGPDLGTNEIVARLEVDPGNEIVIEAEAVGPPRIDSVTPQEAEPGETVEILGQNFSPIGHHNKVRFGAEAGTVREASPTRLLVEVPPFAMDGTVVVELTGVASNGVQFDVLPVPVDAPPVGDVELTTLSGGDGRIVLPFEDATTEYVLILEAMRPNAQSFSATLSGDAIALSASTGAGGLAPASSRTGLVGESLIREMERRAIDRLPATVRNEAPRGDLVPAQEVGSKRDFFVVNEAGPITITDRSSFDQVTATLRFKGDNTLIYVDDRATSGSITDPMMNDLGRRFDDEVYQRQVAAFGEPSDEDANGRVIILLSPTVNSLTTQEIFDQGSRIVGFFFGIDLLHDPLNNPFANDAEVFYSIVPDPNAIFGAAPSETGADYVDLVDGVAAHEFQHMISFNWHVCKNITPCQPRDQQEALWLDEGLSHMAEALVGHHRQNLLRSALFLATPQSTSLVGGGNELDERGAAYLMVQYIVDRLGEQVLKELVQEAGLAGRTGITNINVVTDTAFTFLFHQWAATLLLDGPTLPNDDVFEMPSLNLSGGFDIAKQALNNQRAGTISTDFLDLQSRHLPGSSLTLTQQGTSPAYVRVTSRGRANLPVTIDGASGSELQVTVVRIR